MTRRGFLQGMLAAGLWNALTGRGEAAQPQVKDMKGIEAMQKNWKAYLAEGFKAPLPTEPLKLPNEEWRKRLSTMAYSVLRDEGTERAGTSSLNNEKRDGVFVCAGCDLPVFTSAMKYESGTGWPSFFTAIPGAFGTKVDNTLFTKRTEYHCIRCGGHHGHLFDDGPPPTGQRWCNNGVALKFVPKTG
ncbi:MAG: peptide-methionine (R)-S-oxide reductase MsrB [Betaproteobacteria bacterium]|nr:peptide-methionine (R)-S-oxide reductase MsrB [Betaproteobacteria bacterium]